MKAKITESEITENNFVCGEKSFLGVLSFFEQQITIISRFHFRRVGSLVSKLLENVFLAICVSLKVVC